MANNNQKMPPGKVMPTTFLPENWHHPRAKWHNLIRFRFTFCNLHLDPAPLEPQGETMKQGIHPEYVPTTVTCTCGNTFETRSTIKSGTMRVDVCSACHPFYTGKQKIMDTGGRVARFEARYGKRKRER